MQQVDLHYLSFMVNHNKMCLRCPEDVEFAQHSSSKSDCVELLLLISLMIYLTVTVQWSEHVK